MFVLVFVTFMIASIRQSSTFRVSLNHVNRISLELHDSFTSFSNPHNPSVDRRKFVKGVTAVIPLTLSISARAQSTMPSSMLTTSAEGSNDFDEELPLGKDAYTRVGNLRTCRLLNGMWQVSGAHGYEPVKENVVAEMSHCADEGYVTFDLADIYGPAEDYVGDFCRGPLSSPLAKECNFFTKWVPRPAEMPKSVVTNAITRSLYRMKTDSIDLLQFHWWDYENKNYFDAMHHMMDLQERGTIKNIGLTNFDTEHMSDLMSEGAPIVSNQVSFSILDTRPLDKMTAFSTENNVKLLCYGTLLGGFLSEKWVNKPEPPASSLPNVSLRKYLPWIGIWGGWDLFQELLRVLDVIAKKHSVSISNVALRWVLDQPAVGGTIVGVRFGLKEHLRDNRRVFSFRMDKEDLEAISAVQAKSRSLGKAFGDCGGEYRRRA